ncbi:LAME_0A05644g1_1 [Lachancea meyersii CBS 8951]|uniref:LAME_0A05644g1_1 n=1 Tax=Lachancea meyersii CBS 8951 TaxID=1266667 RepID=A0A1G4IPU0_9SACH|nr:LAME_0A05644g1_1 [Lachancea meyersii CBS 8951]
MNLLSWRKKNSSNASTTTLANENHKGILFKSDARSVEKLAEHLDQNPRVLEKQFGESFTQRGSLLRNLMSLKLQGIGPPDMVHVTKFDKFRQMEIGEYHYLTGLDTSSEAAPIAYLNAIKLSDGSQTTHSSAPNSKSRNKVMTYCTTNIFSHADVRIRFESPKHFQVSAMAVTSGSSNVQLTPDFWDETFVSGFVRAMIINTDKERKLPGLLEFPIALENGLAYAEKCIALLCKFLPRGPELGCDLTRHSYVSFRSNYLIESLLAFLQIARKLNMLVVETLQNLIQSDPKNENCYRIALVAVLVKSEGHDSIAIKTLSESMSRLFPGGNSRLEQDQLTYAADLLNLQIDFLLSKGDFQLALPLAQKSTSICSDNLESWAKLARCYILAKDYKNALLAVNALPSLPATDPSREAMWEKFVDNGFYYRKPLCLSPRSSLQSSEYNFLSSSLKAVKDHDLSSIIFGRIVMPPQVNRGCIEEMWDGPCSALGPIYGPQSKNLINFVSLQEVATLEDSDLLRRNTMAAQLSWSLSCAYDLLMNMVSEIGWNSLLELRSEIFVMERERTTEFTAVLQPELKHKRLCEKWLDELFLNLYEDLKITCNPEEHREEMYSGLKWELLGLTHLRTWNWADAVPCLRTSIMARFDVVSAEKLLDLFLTRQYPVSEVLDPDVLLALVVDKICYESRFYNYLQLPNLRVLIHLCALSGLDNVRNRVYALPTAQRGIVALMDKLLDYIQELND